MEHFRIGYTDVILQDFGGGKGKIIISNDDYGYNFSYYWGVMGNNSTLKDFIYSIDHHYFKIKLAPNVKGEINNSATFTNLRHTLKEWIDLAWYEEMPFQKELRRVITAKEKEAKLLYNVHCFLQFINDLYDELDFSLIECEHTRSEIKQIIHELSSESYDMISFHEPREHIFLANLLNKIKNEKIFNCAVSQAAS